jgi:hypothetical protein
MSQAPSPALLRLREADVVRLCGLGGAARGLELASRRALSHQRRDGARLSAVVEDEQPRRAWVELATESTPAGMRWSCACAVGAERFDDGAQPGSLGCAHVAAIFTSWVRAPSDFVTPTPAGGSERAEAEPGLQRPRLAQPRLMATPPATKPRGATLADELARLQPAAVTAMAQRVLGGELEEREARQALAMALADAARVAGLVARLDVGARDLLASVRLLGGAVTAADVTSVAERAGQPQSAARQDVATLERYGLLFPVSGVTTPPAAQASQASQHPWRAVTGWRMPPELLAALPARLPLASTSTLVAQPTTGDGDQAQGRAGPQPRIQPASARPLARALALLAYAPGPAGLEPTPSGANTALERQGQRQPPHFAAEPPTNVLAIFARAAGVEAGLARMARRLLLWARQDEAQSPLAHLANLPAIERPLALHAGFRLWRDAVSAADLSELELSGTGLRIVSAPDHQALRPDTIAGDVAEARRFVLRLLALLTPREWYRLDDIVDLIWRLRPGFLRGRQLTYETPAWWLERASARRPLRIAEHDEWLAGDGEYIRALIRGPLHWWGACDLATRAGNRSGPADACRLTPLGVALLCDEAPLPEETAHALAADWGPPALPTRDGGLAVQPLAAGFGLMAALARWATPREVAGGRLLYTLSADRACAAFDAGEAADALPRALVAAGLPRDARAVTAVSERITGWRARYGGARIAVDMTLIEAADEATLAEALAYAPELAAHTRRLEHGLAALPTTEVAALRAALARRGYHV